MSDNGRPRVSFDEVTQAMSMVRENAASCYLHRSTGEVVVVFEPDGDEELRERVDADFASYVAIPAEDSRRAYQHLVAFAQTVDDDDIRARLDVALSGRKGVFGRFRDVVFRHADLRARFSAHLIERQVEDVRAWLQRNGLDVELLVPPPPPAPEPAKPRAREPDFVDLLMLGGKTERIAGEVYRVLLLANEAEARAAFERIARQIVEHCGHAWRKRFVEGTSELEVERFRLVHDGARIELMVETAPEIYLRFCE